MLSNNCFTAALLKAKKKQQRAAMKKKKEDDKIRARMLVSIFFRSMFIVYWGIIKGYL